MDLFGAATSITTHWPKIQPFMPLMGISLSVGFGAGLLWKITGGIFWFIDRWQNLDRIKDEELCQYLLPMVEDILFHFENNFGQFPMEKILYLSDVLRRNDIHLIVMAGGEDDAARNLQFLSRLKLLRLYLGEGNLPRVKEVAQGAGPIPVTRRGGN